VVSPVDRELVDRVAAHNAARHAAAVAGAHDDVERLDREAEITFGDPASRLVVYGTLRPGRSNHHLVADLGAWEPATLWGTVGSWEGYPILRPGAGAPVPADLVTSSTLAAHLDRLDDFEGPAYRRELVVVETANGAVVAQCYVDATGTIS